MADGFVVRPEFLSGPTAAFTEAAELLRSAVGQARADLSALGDVCGDDDQGRAFAARYGLVAAHGLDAVRRSADAVASFSDGLRATVGQYAAGDEGAAGGFADQS